MPKVPSGSSPRLWGTDQTDFYIKLIYRFIPTPVGNGSTMNVPRSVRAVHPHACGERDIGFKQVDGAAGSSPRLWGTGPTLPSYPPCTRFIPTPVGNGPVTPGQKLRKAVHPHACGERKLLALHELEIDGSSPRLWGTGASGDD